MITHAFNYLFNVEWVLSLFFYHNLDSFWDCRPVVFTRYLSWVCLVFPHEEIQIMHFWQKYHRSDFFPLIASWQIVSVQIFQETDAS